MEAHLVQVDFATPAYDELVALRKLILRDPLGLEFEVDEISNEFAFSHFGLYDKSDQLLGCFLFVPANMHTVKMRQVAIIPAFQGKGLGSLMVREAEKWCLQNGYKTIVLAARKKACIFYTKLGYIISGDEFSEVGIPHFPMIKHLS